MFVFTQANCRCIYCQQIVRIPMVAGADSLNLAVAGSLLMYEVFRSTRTAEGLASAITPGWVNTYHNDLAQALEKTRGAAVAARFREQQIAGDDIPAMDQAKVLSSDRKAAADFHKRIDSPVSLRNHPATSVCVDGGTSGVNRLRTRVR